MIDERVQQGERYDSTRAAWDHIWESGSVERELQVTLSYRGQHTQRIYETYLPRDEWILEAGSGLSSVLILLRQRGFKMIGMDYALRALELSHGYDPSLALYGGDVHKLPHADNSLGAYLSFGVLEHFEHGMGAALAEAYRVVKPGGVLVLTIPYPNVVHELVAWKRRRRGVTVLNDDDFYESAYTRRQLEHNVSEAGFQLLKILPTSHSFTLWGLGGPFRKPGYYETSLFAEVLGGVLRYVLPWAFNFSTLVIARKPEGRA
jgi:SAM-dependent methyltransferase